MSPEEETYGEAAERLLASLGLPITQERIRLVVDEFLDVRRSTDAVLRSTEVQR